MLFKSTQDNFTSELNTSTKYQHTETGKYVYGI